MKNQSTGILFSGSENNIEAARKHLKINEELFWSQPVKIKPETLTFPLTGLIHAKGDNVRYKCNITAIKEFSESDFKKSTKKPESWIIEWKKGPRSYRATMIVNSLMPFSYKTTDLTKINGEKVKNAPQGYIKVFIPR